MEPEIIAIVSAFGAAWLLLLIVVIVVCVKLDKLRNKLDEVTNGKIKVQKLKVDNDKNHAFRNPNLSPDEELSRRGYSMYVANDDVESGRSTERQSGGQFVTDLQHEIELRQQRQAAPPFLLNGIEDNKRKSRTLTNPVARENRPSDTNPNFIY